MIYEHMMVVRIDGNTTIASIIFFLTAPPFLIVDFTSSEICRHREKLVSRTVVLKRSHWTSFNFNHWWSTPPTILPQAPFLLLTKEENLLVHYQTNESGITVEYTCTEWTTLIKIGANFFFHFFLVMFDIPAQNQYVDIPEKKIISLKMDNCNTTKKNELIAFKSIVIDNDNGIYFCL